MSTLPEPRILKFTRWLNETRGLNFDPTTVEGYDAMWRWSVSDLAGFWSSIWDYFEVRCDTPYTRVLGGSGMLDAEWFEGSRVNYAEHLLRYEERAAPDRKSTRLNSSH